MRHFKRQSTSKAQGDAVHSFEKYWRCPQKAKEKRPGKPALKWTDSQERKLFRLIYMSVVTMDNIATAMYEPATNDKPEFAPCNSTCRNKWNRMTELQPSEVRIYGVFRRSRQRRKLEDAFERYQLRKAQSTLGSSNQLASTENIPFHNDALQPGVESAGNPATATLSPPPLTFDGTSPNDSSALTPAPLHPLRLGTKSDGSSSFTGSVTRSLNDGIENLPQHKSARGIEPLCSIDSSDLGEGAALFSSPQPHPSLGQSHCCIQANQTRISSGSGISLESPRLQVNKLSAVAGDESKATTSKKTRKTIADVEDREGISRGLIDFVKYQLTKSRWSVTSTISELGSDSRFSRRYSGLHPTLTCNCTGGSAAAQSQSGLWGCALEPNLFQALRAASATCNDVTARLKELLRDMGANEAKETVNTRSCLHETALQVALDLGNIPACRFLLTTGADVSALTSNGQTLSTYGRIAQRKAINNAHYLAIGVCKNEIRSAPPQKSPMPTDLERPIKRARLTSAKDQQDKASLGCRRTVGISAFKSTHIRSQPQESFQTPNHSSSVITNMDGVTNVGNLSASGLLNSRANPSLRPSATSKPEKSQNPRTVRSQTTLPAVPSLVKQFDSLVPGEHSPSGSTSNNSFHKTQPHSTSNGLSSDHGYGHPTDLLPSTFAEVSAPHGIKLTESQSTKLSIATFGSTHPSGQWERLPDDRLAFIPHQIPFVDGIRTPTQDPQFSHRPLKQKNPHREACVMGDYNQVQYPLVPKNSEQTLTPAGLPTSWAAQSANHLSIPSVGDDVTMNNSFQSLFQPQLQNFLLGSNASLPPQTHPDCQTAAFGVLNNQYPAVSSHSNTMNGSAVDSDYNLRNSTSFGPNVISAMQLDSMSDTIQDDVSIPTQFFRS